MECVLSIKSAELACSSSGLTDYPDLAESLALWQRMRGTAFAPKKDALDPIDFKAVLPRIMLVEVTTDDPPRFRFRLSGTGICDVHGCDLKHLYAEELTPPEYGRLVQRHYLECYAEREPLAHVIALETTEKLRSYARIVLPLGDRDGARISHLLVIDSEWQNSLGEFLEKIEEIDRTKADSSTTASFGVS